MNEPSFTPPPPSTPAEFPNGNARDGIVYQMANPANPLQQLVIVSMETYVKQGNFIQQLRQTAQRQDARIKELLVQLETTQRVLADTTTRLDNLRAVRKDELRPDVEAMLGIGPSVPTGNQHGHQR